MATKMKSRKSGNRVPKLGDYCDKPIGSRVGKFYVGLRKQLVATKPKINKASTVVNAPAPPASSAPITEEPATYGGTGAPKIDSYTQPTMDDEAVRMAEAARGSNQERTEGQAKAAAATPPDQG